jgi:hypothetical protein
VFAEVQVSHLLEVVWVSFAATVAISIVFSVVVLGSARHAEARRSGHRVAALAYGTLALLAFAGFAGGVVFGVQVMLAK